MSRRDGKAAFRKLAREYHPDVSKLPDAEARFKEINEAYEVLSDTENRRKYDDLGANWSMYEQAGAAGGDADPPRSGTRGVANGARPVEGHSCEILELADAHRNDRFSRPVHGDDGRLVGIISIGDAVKHRLEQAVEEAEEMRSYIHTA